MIRLVDVHKWFKAHRVLTGCNLEIRDRETLTIIGGSGTGKSVTLKLMVGLLRPNRGQIFIDDQEISRMEEAELFKIQNKFAYVFQGGALFDSLTVGENVAFGLRQLKKYPPQEIAGVVREKLELVGLSGIEALKPAELSGGMRKRVAIARAIAMNPEYILYDEPTTGLDPIMADVINDLILRLQEKVGITSIVVTHDMKSAYKVSDRIAMLYEGKIIETDVPDNIEHSRDPIVHQFVTGSARGPIQMKVREF